MKIANKTKFEVYQINPFPFVERYNVYFRNKEGKFKWVAKFKTKDMAVEFGSKFYRDKF